MTRIFAFFLFLAGLAQLLLAGEAPDSASFPDLRWRMIGPHRGGRTVGVAGIPGEPGVFYIGVNNGGVWRTNDYGRTWRPIFDREPTGSIGALAVAPSNPNILYVGSGEGLQRPDLSVGDGMFKSTDAGSSWQHVGLADAQQIGAVAVDPRDPDRVFAAVLGHPYGPNAERGLFRSLDGGKSWQKVLYKDENTGAIAVGFNPGNPEILYAVLWASRQGPWENGSWQGTTSGLFRSKDGGSTWQQLTGGLPGTADGLGRIGFAIAPGDPGRMYALVESSQRGGLYRSDDAGDHWTLVNSEERISGRGSDFAEAKVDPRNKDVLFVANTCTYRSTDGGSTFTAVKGAPGGDDYHGIWINPLHPEIRILTSDQGATITVNDGESWSSWYNQPTAQFYHVITDNEFPYNVYGGQQESGSVGIVSRGNDGQITFREWHPVGTDEWSYIAPDPLHPSIIYGGKVARYDRSTGQVQNVAPEAVRSGKYRYLRTMPLVFSPADPHVLFLASTVVFRTTSGGQKWEAISPDLSREAPGVPASVGIFRTPEMEKQPRRGVIYALAPSPLDARRIWAGTDDGLVHVTEDGGKEWKNVTPAPMTAWSKVAGIEAGHFDEKTAYAAVNRIRLDDMRPHIYRTHTGGAAWEEIVQGLPENGPVNVVREDPVRKGLLYAGTERAVYVSLDDGASWLPLRLNMPATSIRDLVVHDADLVVATHGRSFWILDDVTPLRQLGGEVRAELALFKPHEAYRVRWNGNTDTPIPPDEPAGENPPDGAVIDYRVPAGAEDVTLEVFDGSHKLVRKFSSSDPPEQIDEKSLTYPTYWIRPQQRVSSTAGVHRFVWDLHYPPPSGVPRSFPISAILHNTASQPVGPWVPPGLYTVTLTVAGRKTGEQPLTVRMDPRIAASPQVLAEQSALSMRCFDANEQLSDSATRIRGIRHGAQQLSAKASGQPLKDSLASFVRKLDLLEGGGVEAGIDAMYFSAGATPAATETLTGLQTKMIYLMGLFQSADAPPTEAQKNALAMELDVLKGVVARMAQLERTDLAAINSLLGQAGLEPLGWR